MDRIDIMQEMSNNAGRHGIPKDCDDRAMTASEVMRKFESGATRDTDNNKHDPEAFLSPLVIDRYNQFMHENRRQKDGTLRDGDNWQKGMPLTVYAKSMWRHFLDFWKHHRGYGYLASETLEVALCAIMFNAMGYLHELLKERGLLKPMKLSVTAKGSMLCQGGISAGTCSVGQSAKPRDTRQVW